MNIARTFLKSFELMLVFIAGIMVAWFALERNYQLQTSQIIERCKEVAQLAIKQDKTLRSCLGIKDDDETRP